MQIRFSLLKCDPLKTSEVAEKIVQLSQVTEIYTLMGEYDLLIKFRLAETELLEFEKFVDERVRTIDGVRETNTLVTNLWFA